MPVKYEYVFYLPHEETPDAVAEEFGTLSADEVVRLYPIVANAMDKGVVDIARREKGALAWHDVPEAYSGDDE